jgi:hypothetical protein
MSTTILAVRVDAIPAAMAAEARWVCWRLVVRSGKSRNPSLHQI